MLSTCLSFRQYPRSRSTQQPVVITLRGRFSAQGSWSRKHVFAQEALIFNLLEANSPRCARSGADGATGFPEKAMGPKIHARCLPRVGDYYNCADSKGSLINPLLFPLLRLLSPPSSSMDPRPP